MYQQAITWLRPLVMGSMVVNKTGVSRKHSQFPGYLQCPPSGPLAHSKTVDKTVDDITDHKTNRL
jgi:hypothetical protein